MLTDAVLVSIVELDVGTTLSPFRSLPHVVDHGIHISRIGQLKHGPPQQFPPLVSEEAVPLFFADRLYMPRHWPLRQSALIWILALAADRPEVLGLCGVSRESLYVQSDIPCRCTILAVYLQGTAVLS